MRLPVLAPHSPIDSFPPVEHALREPNGLLCAGGDLSTERLLAAYQRGIFPWYTAEDPILWWSPDPRAVLRFDELKVSRSLARTLKRGAFRVTADRAFDDVVANCAAPRREGGTTWIVREMRQAYGALHRLGHAHSIEVWEGKALVGGLYGVEVGGVFCGESMFSWRDDASKVALVTLVRLLEERDGVLIDCQVPNPHLARLGAGEVPRAAFMRVLSAHASPLRPSVWTIADAT